MYTSNLLSKIINYFSVNLFNSLGNNAADMSVSIKSKKTTPNHATSRHIYPLSNKTSKLNEKLKTKTPVNFSKSLSKVESKLSFIKTSYLSFVQPLNYISYNGNRNIHIYPKTINKFNLNNLNLTQVESRYVYGTFPNNLTQTNNSNRSLKTSLYSLYKLHTNTSYPIFFDFNIEKNLNNAKQQR